MAQRIGAHTIRLTEEVCISASAGVAGPMEKQGPLGAFFDRTFEDERMGESTWEKAESRLQNTAVHTMLDKAGLQPTEVDVIFAGDLLNQCISSTFGLRELQIPLCGQYGACSTMAQSLAMAAVFVDAGAAQRAAAVTSSHFCAAERQFRLPLDYGGQRTPTAQWTVTGAGAALLCRGAEGPRVRCVTIGTIRDYAVKDVANMGAAMAPAAADTLLRFFEDTGTAPTDYDLVLTGDLGLVGSTLLRELMKQHGRDIAAVHNDCGMMIYDPQRQDVHAGGSGCGCAASVFCSAIMQRLKRKGLRRMLFMATGALMSPTSSQQGESIPGIAHLLEIEA